jgi:exopolysaccharide production protein ExoQ
VRGGRIKDAFAFLALFSLWDGDGLRDLLSWYGFGALSATLLVGAIVICIRKRGRLKELLTRPSAIPILAFMALCVLSSVWSAYPIPTLLACGIQIATALVGVSLLLIEPWRRLVLIFAAMIHTHLVLSVLFEVVVALLPGHQLLPFWTDYGSNAPGAYYWSQGLLFSGGRIQGIVGNANLTCFLALLGLIVMGALLAARLVRRRVAIPLLALDVVMMALTRSATVFVAAAVVVAAALVALGYRRFGTVGRAALTVAAVIVVGLGALSSSRLSEPLLRVLGKGDDLTGRLEIWNIVGSLVAQRPVLGWGWISYWAPWIPPFDRLVVRGGVQYLQAHNAYLDIEMQLGIPGLLALAAVVGSLVYRSLRLAVMPRPLVLLPLLLTAALLTQGLAESRLLIEGNWALLVALSVAVPWVPVPRSVLEGSVSSPERGNPLPASPG